MKINRNENLNIQIVKSVIENFLNRVGYNGTDLKVVPNFSNNMHKFELCDKDYIFTDGSRYGDDIVFLMFMSDDDVNNITFENLYARMSAGLIKLSLADAVKTMDMWNYLTR